jgi:tetratricopeptide (TPR) repeat protein
MRPVAPGILMGLWFFAAPPLAACAASLASSLEKCGHASAHNMTYCDAAISSGKLPPGKLALAYTYRGQHWQVADEFDRAIADYSEAIRLDPKSVGAYYDRSNCYAAQGNADKTIADLDAAIRLIPKLEIAFTNRGLSWLGKGDYERATADLNTARDLEPNDSLTYWGLGMTHYAQGQFDAATADLREAWAKKPKDSSMSALYAIWSYLAQSRAEGKEAAATALAANEPYIDMNRWPAVLVQVLAGKQSAEQAYQAASDSQETPQHRSQMTCITTTVVGEWYLINAQRAEARSNLERARDACPAVFNVYRIVLEDLQRIGS